MLKGNSGCLVEVRESGGRLFVRKTCAPEYASRLKHQSVIQKKFRYRFGARIRVPEVYEVGEHHFDMEYIPWMDWIDFVESAPRWALDQALGRIRFLLTFEARMARNEYVLFEKVKQKMDSVCSCITDDVLFDYAAPVGFFYEMLEEAKSLGHAMYPSYLCHGDLTLSNMLFSPEGDVAVIDMLDSFLQSPWIDYIKMRQSALFHWESVVAQRPHDSVKVRIADSLVRDALDGFAPLYEVRSNRLFIALEVLNYLRIVPYVNGTALAHVKECASAVMEEAKKIL